MVTKTQDYRVALLRQLLDWCEELSEEGFKDTPSFTAAMTPLLDQEPDDDWDKRVGRTALRWVMSAAMPAYVEDAPDLDLYSMFLSAVWKVYYGHWDKVAEFFED